MTPDRRSVLAGLATGAAGALAGCRALGGDDGVEFERADVESILARSVPEYVKPSPVTPRESAVRAGLDRAEELIAAVPGNVGRETVPNGVIRREIRERRQAAVKQRRDVTEAETRYLALAATRGARRDAAEAAGAYRAATDGVTLEGARSERDRTVDRVRGDLSAVAYVGNDRDRTLYTLQQVERMLHGALQSVDRSLRSVNPSALDVGDLVGRAEYGRATHEVVDHVLARHRARLAEELSFRKPFETALERSVDAVADRSLPEEDEDPADLVDTPIADTPAEEVLEHAVRSLVEAGKRLEDPLAEGRLAAGLRQAYTVERDVGAYERVRERVEAGELGSLTDPATVRDARERALEELASAPYDPETPSLPAAMLTRAGQSISRIDGTVRRYYLREETEPVPADEIVREYGLYVLVADGLAALPDAVETVEERFGA